MPSTALVHTPRPRPCGRCCKRPVIIAMRHGGTALTFAAACQCGYVIHGVTVGAAQEVWDRVFGRPSPSTKRFMRIAMLIGLGVGTRYGEQAMRAAELELAELADERGRELLRNERPRKDPLAPWKRGRN